MLVKNKRPFIKGLVLAISFIGVLVVMFSPIFGGENALESADRLFNSISKGSTNFFPTLEKKVQKFEGKSFTANLRFAEDGSADKASKLLKAAGATVQQKGGDLAVSGHLAALLRAAIADSQVMFENNEDPLKKKYGVSGKEGLFVWWSCLRQMNKELTKQKNFKEAAVIREVVKKGVEVSYNFFGIESEAAATKIGVLSFAMVFYVIYTLWWGIAILSLFEGIGMQLKKAAKKEM